MTLVPRQATAADPAATEPGTNDAKRYPKLKRKREAVAEVELRHSEMQSISDRLGRVGEFPWASMWVAGATLLGGGLVGGALGLIPFLSTDPGPSNWDRLIYFGALGVAAIATVGCVIAAITTHRERSESVAAIKRDYDKYLLDTFEMDEPRVIPESAPTPVA